MRNKPKAPWRRWVVLAALCVAPASLHAEGPPPPQNNNGGGPGPQQNNDNPPPRPHDHGMREGRRGDRPDFFEQDRQESEHFFQANSPNRFKAWDSLKNKNPMLHGRLQRLFVNQYVQLRMLQRQDEKLYKMRVEQIKKEDEIFGLITDFYEKNPKPEKAQLAQLRTQLVPLDTDLVQLRLQEEQLRIEHLESMLAEARRNYEEHRTADPTKAVDAQIEDQMKQANNLTPAGLRPTSGPSPDDNRPSGPPDGPEASPPPPPN